jgi:hypothetical protein
MLRILAVFAALVLTAPAFAGNARSDRTALTTQQYLYRQQTLNAQWAQHFRAQQQDMRNYYERDIHAEPSRYGNLVRRNELNRSRWLSNAPRAYINLSVPQSFGSRRY